jgi:predicted ribosome quality control (RQC) complex YloA/Tae2 family protein
MIVEEFQNYELRLGKNKKENDQLITDASDNDYWVHISNYPSGHCIIANPENIKIDKKILKRACCLVKQHSKCSSIKKLKFDITQIKYIEKTRILGQVIVSKFLKQITI